jgi:hypothetical protein
MSTRDWTAITRLRFFALLKKARSLKQHGVNKHGRFVFSLGYMSGFDDGGLKGFEQGAFHFLPVNNVQEALQCAHKLDAENTARGGFADAEPIVAVNATPSSQKTFVSHCR